MSYMVPGKKPRHCRECHFRDLMTGECSKQNKDYPNYDAQYEGCPLLDVPPHDELVERGKLFEALNSLPKKPSDDVMRLVISAETVIEADWSGEI